jgi:peptidoglycan/LPS O-acetylase OafA/YrhL
MNGNIGHPCDDRLLDHLYSLGIEEQFYLVWPAVVWFVPRPRLRWVCGAGSLGRELRGGVALL